MCIYISINIELSYIYNSQSVMTSDFKHSIPNIINIVCNICNIYTILYNILYIYIIYIYV